jgi:hypothetical protein
MRTPSHVDAIAARDLHPALAFGARKHVERLKSELGESESLLQISWSTSPNFATGLLALTDRRLVYVRKIVFLPAFRIRVTPLEDIAAVNESMGAVGVVRSEVELRSGERIDFRFTPEATNREAIIDLLRVLPDERRKKVRPGDVDIRQGP